MSRHISIALIVLLSACGFANAAAPPAPATTATTQRSPRKLPPVPPGVTIERDVAYLTPDRKEKLDLYLPANRDRAMRSPAIVIIHGGGWVGGDKASEREFSTGTTLAAAGYVCAAINYKLDGDGRWPTNLFDCKNAVRFLRARADQYQIDGDLIGVIGGSAGGHLALMVAYTSDVADSRRRIRRTSTCRMPSAALSIFTASPIRARGGRRTNKGRRSVAR
jgi:acetyl esterase/lipase